MRDKPALKIALLFSLGIAIAFWIPHCSLPVALAAILLLTFILLFPKSSLATARSILLVPAVGIIAFQSAYPPEPKAPHYVEFQGVALEDPVVRRGSFSFPAQIYAIGVPDEAPRRFRAKVWMNGKGVRQIEAGSRIAGKGLLAPFSQPRNPGAFDLRTFRLNNGFIGRIVVDEISSLGNDGERVPHTYRIRSLIGAACEKYGKRDEALWQGLILGFRRDIDPALMEELRVTGLTHLLALSGLNVAFLAGAFIGLSAISGVSPRVRALAAILLVATYALLIPDRGGTTRAALMVIAAFLGQVLQRGSSGLNTLGLASFVALIYRPGDLFDAGFQMSVAATAGILLLNTSRISTLKSLARRNRATRLVVRWGITPLLVSVAASLFVAPITAYFFMTIPLAGPIWNLWAVPLMSVVYAGIWATLGLSLVSSGAASYVSDGVLAASEIWQWLVRTTADYSPLYEVFLGPGAALLMILAGIWMLSGAGRLRFRLAAGSLWILLILLMNDFAAISSRTRVWFLDVGHGDASVWSLAGGDAVVVDGGPAPSFVTRGPVELALRRLGVEEIALLSASHSEADHTGEIGALIKTFPVKQALVSGTFGVDSAGANLLSLMNSERIPVKQVEGIWRLDSFSDGGSITAFSAAPLDSSWSANDRSLTLKLCSPTRENGTARLLSPGDVQRRGEKWLVANGDVSAGLLKAPHHGSPSSSSAAFLSRVSPKDVVITRSSLFERGATSGRQEVLNRYKELDVAVSRTDREGAVLFEAVGNVWRKVDWRKPGLLNWLLGRF